MKDFAVSVRKLTDEELLRCACASTFIGESRATLGQLYKAEHSPVRTQFFWIELKHIPLYVSTHLLRHHVGSIPFQLTCREDRNGGNPGLPAKIDDAVSRLCALFADWEKGGAMIGYRNEELAAIIEGLHWLKENADRYTPVNLGLCVNAQALIDMAKLRLCTGCAAPETVTVFREIKNQIRQIDPALAAMMVRKCVYRNGICGEMRCCGFNSTPAFENELRDYTSRFTEKQKGNKNQSITTRE